MTWSTDFGVDFSMPSTYLHEVLARPAYFDTGDYRLVDFEIVKSGGLVTERAGPSRSLFL